MKQANGHTNGHTNGTVNGHTNGHAAAREPVSKPGINAFSILRVVLLLIAWAAVVPFLFELMSIVLASWRYYTDADGLYTGFWETDGEKLEIVDDMANSTLLSRSLLNDGYFAQFMIWWWVPTIAAVLCVAALPAVPYAKRVGVRGAFASIVHKGKAIGGLQLYPRSFWMWFAGGMTITEAFLLAVWIVLHAVMLWNWYAYYVKSYNYVNDVVGMDFAIPRKQVNLERVALSFGWLCFLDLSVLFWPIAHNSFLHTVTGIPYAGLIRFHQWVGHTTMWSTTFHGVLYYIYWGIDNDINGWAKFADWGIVESINNLAGSVSWFFGIALWITSFNYIRRRWYQVFHSVHIIGFLGYVLFAIVHYPGMWASTVPGLLLYAADVAFRMVQSSNVTMVKAWRVVGKGNNRTIVMTLPVDKDVVQKPLHDYFINFPGVSRWHWHPLTCLYPQGAAAGSVTFAMKEKGKWSQAVIDEIIKKEHVPVRVNGPMGGESILSENYDQLLLIAGGVAATPMLSVIEDLVHRRSQGGVAAGVVPHGVRLIWTSREREEFTLISEAIMSAASCGDGWLQIDLIYSGSVTVPVHQQLKGTPDQLTANKMGPDGAAVHELVQAQPEGKTFFKSGQNGVALSSSPITAGSCPLKFPGTSALFWDRVRPIQPKALNNWHLALCTILSFVGAFFGVILSNAMYIEYYTSFPSNRRYWQPGMVIFCVLLVMALGLPLILVVFPVQLFRYIKSGSKAYREKDAIVMSSGMERTAALLMDETVGFAESGMALPIKIGRMDLTATLQETVARHQKSERVGFYIGGPESMVRTGCLTAWALNDKRKGPYLNVHRATWEL